MYAQKSLRAKRAMFAERPKKKGKISNFNEVTGSKFKISPFCWDKFQNSPLFIPGQNSKFTTFIGSKFEIYPFLLGQKM